MAVKFLGHPVHQMLIVFPLGLLGASVVFDVMAGITADGGWLTASYFMISAGVAGGLLAAPFGFIDWLGIERGTRARSIGAIHGLGNVLVLTLFASSWLIRRTDPLTPTLSAYLLSGLGFLVALVTGWLGGELVTRLGIGVDAGANVNAPSSLM